jgi:asparagine synthase (glutamine-hydrolysing)
VDEDAGIALGHRRLSILDLSPLGNQPMSSADGRFIIAYNGEIYNFPDLRTELASMGHSFRSQSDTEVLLSAISQWGVSAALERTNGMFAFALWDRETRTLYLARDRIGQKPLYYGWAGKTLVFGSELKALLSYPGFSTAVNEGAVALLLRHSAIPAPHTIYPDCWKLLPGTVLAISAGDIADRALPAPSPFWSATAAAQAGLADPLDLDDRGATDSLDNVLRDAVGACMVSDVPLGAFLSGGIDSSTVVALMQEQSDRPVKTFSIGFTEASYNEAIDAAAVAKHLGTDHTELYVTPGDAQSVIPRLPEFYDEPFADSSQIPTYLVSQLARQQVTVSLSGDGGDETFGGYNRYTWARNLNRTVGLAPRPLRRLARCVMESIPPHKWDAAFALIAPVLPRGKRHIQAGDKLHKLAEIIDSANREEMYWRLVSQWKQPGQAIPEAVEPATLLSRRSSWPELPEFAQQIMLLDTLSYLPDDILVKLDRASMAVSLESRVPLLDHNVMEFAWRLPMHQKIRNGTGKWILRQVLSRYVPPALFERPKMGFGVPIGDWLRGDLREWAEDLLSESRLKQEGLFQTDAVRSLWRQHLRGDRNLQYQLWPVLMFEAWRDSAH